MQAAIRTLHGPPWNAAIERHPMVDREQTIARIAARRIPTSWRCVVHKYLRQHQLVSLCLDRTRDREWSRGLAERAFPGSVSMVMVCVRHSNGIGARVRGKPCSVHLPIGKWAGNGFECQFIVTLSSPSRWVLWLVW